MASCLISKNRCGSGFTLPEMLITLLISTLLGCVAYPSYQEQLRKGRRLDAIQSLTQMQLAQEQYRASHLQYASAAAQINVRNTSEAGHYDLFITAATATSFEVAAVARAESSQQLDTSCARMSIAVSNGAVQYAGNTPESRCWPW